MPTDKNNIIITKKAHTFKFHDREFKKWQRIANKNRVPLTTLIEKVMNKHADEPHLFI